MKRYLVLLAVVFLVLAGCANHYYSVKADMVELYLTRADATVVQFASSLDGYQLHRAERSDQATWTVMVPAYREFAYFYIVDGAMFLPPCRFKEKDDFGSTNCIYIPGS